MALRMRGPTARGVLLPFLSVLFLWLTPAGFSATLLLTTPDPVVCVTSDDAEFEYTWGTLKPRAGLFSFAPPGQAALAPLVHPPRSAGPGDLVRIHVTEEEDIDSLSAQILDSRQHVLFQGMGFRPDSASRSRWVVLVGVSSQTRKGEYSLRVTVQAGARSAVFLSSVSVVERAFRFERIPLNRDLTTLRTEKDPRKTAEAREMALVLATPHADAVYEEGTILVPLAGARRTSGYGDRRKYVYTDNSVDSSVHEGLDIASPLGTPVPASGRGRVVLAGSRIMTGNTVIIEHLPGLFSIYFHLAEIAVKPGDVVAEGDIIGKVGMTGLATGPHLHWEIQALGVPIDPDALAAGPILDRSADFGDIGTSKDPKGGE